MKAANICKEQDIQFILAVGGGSVIDGVKYICGAAKYDGDAWDVLEKKPNCIFKDAINSRERFNPSCNRLRSQFWSSNFEVRNKTKTLSWANRSFLQFSLCDPNVVASLPKRQIANGIADAYMHTLEQYLTYPSDNYLQERQAEGILSTLIEIGPKSSQTLPITLWRPTSCGVQLKH